jgi:hypothetical protein
MPAAAPIPRGPTVLTLYSAADLLSGPGCPVCRYTGESASRYLAWFALEAHAQTATITRLCASLGMCPRHIRGLMSQSGAAARLTAVYRYVIEAARGRLAGRAGPPGPCPGCEHDGGAAGRSLDTLLDGLTDAFTRNRCRELGGLCIPHLRAAAARGRRRPVAWLEETLQEALGQPGSPAWLAGTDYDTATRAALRQALPARAGGGTGICLACLAAARAEQLHLTRLLHAGDPGRPDRRLLVCGGHLNDLAHLAGPGGVRPLLAWQAGCLAASLNRGSGPPGGKRPPRPRWPWLSGGATRPAGCPVCQESGRAARHALGDFGASLGTAGAATASPPPLCVRHLIGVRAAPWAGELTAGAVRYADALIADLKEAFGQHPQGGVGSGSGTAWRQAVAFLDGGALCGLISPATPGGKALPYSLT